MSRILAIETAGASCSVALNIDGEIKQLIDVSERSHARRLLPMVDELLVGSRLSLSDLDGIAFGIGPGSFTGLRIGMGVVQGLAFGAELPVWGVSTLQVMAVKAARQFGVIDGAICSALDARMNQVYCAVYEIFDGVVLNSPLLPDCALSPLDASKALPSELTIAVGDGIPLIADCGLAAQYVEVGLAADAETIAGLAIAAYIDGLFGNVLDVELNYIRNEVSWKKHQPIRPRAN